MHKSDSCGIRKVQWVSIAVMAGCFFVEYVAILVLNQGFFTYTLDDPYIHLALAEHIQSFHYGINGGEYSAPSSSILWPVILAPVSSFSWAPLVINVLCAFLTILVLVRILNRAIILDNMHVKARAMVVMTVTLIVCLNIIGLVFTGMEHMLQVLLVVIIAQGMIIHNDTGHVPRWLFGAVICAPLIRYENAAIALATIVYLFSNGYVKRAMIMFAIIFAMLTGFSLFLIQLDMGPLPSSVMCKSFIEPHAGHVSACLANLMENLAHPSGILFSLAMAALISYILLCRDGHRKCTMALACVITLFLHMVFGKNGWYERYEVYTWTFFLCIGIYLSGRPLSSFLSGFGKRGMDTRITLIMSIWCLAATPRYLYCAITTPLAANNIYEQHYQMHRFVVQYYQKPVAVNDLGYVSYKNDNYVLDLWGLGSVDVQRQKMYAGTSVRWMDACARQKGVALAMIYDHWFEKVPDDWVRIGALRLGNPRITPAGNEVVFYAIDTHAYMDVVAALERFIPALPPGVTFHYTTKSAIQ